jgi:hypothetical protein
VARTVHVGPYDTIARRGHSWPVAAQGGISGPAGSPTSTARP